MSIKYTESTTHTDRIKAASMACGLMSYAEQAQRMMNKVWERWFSKAEQEPINEWEAEEIGDIIYAASEMLFYSLREFKCETGAHRVFREVDFYLDRVQEYLSHSTVTELNDEALKISSTIKDSSHKEAFDAARRAACNLPDDQAIAALSDLVKREARA